MSVGLSALFGKKSCEIDEPTRGAHAIRTAESGETFLSRKGLLCVWHLNQPEAPQKYHTNFVVIVVVEFSTANVMLIASVRVVVFFFFVSRLFSFFWVFRILCCDGEPTSCCFAPDRGHLVFAGMREGSVALWDLRETASLHQAHSLGTTHTQCVSHFVTLLSI